MKIKKSKIFYKAEITFDEEIIGHVYPLHLKYLNKDRSSYATNTLSVMSRYVYSSRKFPDFKPLIGNLRLERKAKKIDFVSSLLFRVPLASKKAFEALKNLNFGDHKIFPARIYIKNKPVLYFFLAAIPFGQNDTILWDKCHYPEIQTSNDKEPNINDSNKCEARSFPLKSVDDYYIFSFNHDIELDQIAVNEAFPIDTDYFKFNCMNAEFVSEKFVETALSHDLKGLDFKKTVQIVQYG